MRSGEGAWNVGSLVGAIVLTLVSSVPLAWGVTSIEEIETVYRQEINDQAHFLAYARQAEVEGLREEGGLFRALARAEGIHSQIEELLIRKMGGEASASLEPARVGTTEENLKTAIETEDREQHGTYPALVQQLRRAQMAQAADVIQRLQDAEGQHKKLLTLVLSSRRSGNTSRHRFFYVCPKCGYVTEKIAFEQCPDCLARSDSFEMVG